MNRKRLEDEEFIDYRADEKKNEFARKWYLKGRVVWHGKQGPYILKKKILTKKALAKETKFFEYHMPRKPKGKPFVSTRAYRNKVKRDSLMENEK